ncbi:MAG: Rid family detoxifying hydrolase [Devosia sp.]
MSRSSSIEGLSVPGPGAMGPYSDITRIGELLFLSGRIGIARGGAALVTGGIAAQTKQALANIAEVLALVGGCLDDVVKANVYLTDMADFAVMNEIYGGAFGERKPSRTTVGVAALPMGALVEIEAIAAAKRP